MFCLVIFENTAQIKCTVSAGTFSIWPILGIVNISAQLVIQKHEELLYVRRCASTKTVDASFTKKIYRSMIQDWSMFGRVRISAQLKTKDHNKFMHVSKGICYVCKKINLIWVNH